MRTMITGLTGWASMQRARTPQQRTVDTALTAVGTLLAALTWAILHG